MYVVSVGGTSEVVCGLYDFPAVLSDSGAKQSQALREYLKFQVKLTQVIQASLL